MNERMQAWVAALRSGNYLQGRERLHITQADDKQNYYCCLGVAAEKAVLGGLDVSQAQVESLDPDVFFAVEYDGNRTSLTSVIWEWYGFGNSDDDELARSTVTFQNNLINLNDAHRADFDTIADYIEECFATGKLVVLDPVVWLNKRGQR